MDAPCEKDRVALVPRGNIRPRGPLPRMLTQLNPPLPLETPKGCGLAHFVIDYGPEAHLLWVVFMDEGGACWTVPNPEIRIQCNWSLKRREKPVLPAVP